MMVVHVARCIVVERIRYGEAPVLAVSLTAWSNLSWRRMCQSTQWQ